MLRDIPLIFSQTNLFIHEYNLSFLESMNKSILFFHRIFITALNFRTFEYRNLFQTLTVLTKSIYLSFVIFLIGRTTY